MTPQEIQNALRKNKSTQKAIAGRLGVSEMSVSRVIHRLSTSDRIMGAVARAIGKPKTHVFPDYYYGPKRRSTSKALGRRAAR